MVDENIEKQRLKVCFVSLNSYPLLANNDQSYVGGAEIQQVGLARELNKRGYDVSFITYGGNNNNFEKIDGIKIVQTYDRNKVNKFGFLKKVLVIWKKMVEIDADVYFHRVGTPGITSLFGMFHRKKIIQLIASDADVTGETIIQKTRIADFLGKFARRIDIKLSDIVVSQNSFQKSTLRDKFKVNTIMIRNAFNIPSHSQIEINDELSYVLWIGTIRSVKNPELFLELAKYFPKQNFLMIGGEGENPELFNKIKNAANDIQNLEFKGFVSRDKIFDYYKKGLLLVSTSETEGFPNVFLEAWWYSMPVVSLNVDPDGTISRYELGYHSKSFDKMKDDVKTLLECDGLRQFIGERGRSYVERNHDIKNIADKYEEMIKNLLKNNFKIEKKD